MSIAARLHHRGGLPRTRGAALLTVLVFSMLSILLALWAARTAWYGERVVGNDADYQRAFEAAEALLLDAELDIRGERADGRPCAYGGLPRGAAAGVCRSGGATKLPLENADVPAFLAALSAQPQRCIDALCAKRVGRQDIWNAPAAGTAPRRPGEQDLFALMRGGSGARYGQYTGAQLGDAAQPAHPILADRAEAEAGGWYWIEVIPYIDSKPGLISNAPSHQLELVGLLPHVVYRITAVAFGRKPDTLVVVEQSYARPRRKD
ncbi:pilus assembly protein PilX [Comamonas piscis]|uniref:Pilus assembly protein PilX n=1 Tax=Comamonas piscis TaxID=1562974 RepID=A0A7G5EFL5_9BURK|nr:pilus assembly protein PilX [Comamonas piscis]QMV72790.1 pilus assembly protein PilX [Comamonas piscis]WSO35567.1 pilus assembly protein PilX [Comamonas piscis]